MNGQNVSVFRVSRWMLIFATATFAIVTASPLVWMVSASLKEPAEIFNSSLIPQHPTLENFRYVFVRLANTDGESRLGTRSLSIQFDCMVRNTAPRVGTRTLMTPAEARETHYALMASPTLFPVQTVRAGVKADAGNAGSVICRLYVSVYGRGDSVEVQRGDAIAFPPGGTDELVWRITDLGGAPIASVGIELRPENPGSGTVFLDYLDWTGVPDTTFRMVGEACESNGMWPRAWVNAVDNAATQWPSAFHL